MAAVAQREAGVNDLRIRLPRKFQELFRPHRWKIAYGGRGGAKSHSFARALLLMAANNEHERILCTREYQTSIKDSVHRLLRDLIDELSLYRYFEVTEAEIRCPGSKSEFIFRGLQDLAGIKSMEGITKCWVEEGQFLSKDNLLVLEPTIRDAGSEIWVSYNPVNDDDPIHVQTLLFEKNPRPDRWVQKVGWEDNKYLSAEAHRSRLDLLELDPVAYEHVYGGSTVRVGEAVIFRDRVVFDNFETPADARFFHGVDWGFANDPTVIVRCWMSDDERELFIDQEAYGHGVEIDDTAKLFNQIPSSSMWPIKADNSRPETISYMKRQLAHDKRLFNISAATKWSGSVEDGIKYLRGFRKIHCHQRCKNLAQEFRLYSYKVDKKTKDVLPVVEDRFNHGPDALRYALDGYIVNSSNLGTWIKLGREP